jgi:IS30 family transposase
MPSHLTLIEREKISQMRFAKASADEIAVALNRSRSTIFRELKRNSDADEYGAVVAQQRTELRRKSRPLLKKIDQPQTNEIVRQGLVKYWSPEQIAGRMIHDKVDAKSRVSRSSIERWIKSDPQRKHWESFLRRRGKKRPRDDRRGQLPSTTPISGRPAIVETRERCGDWEGDTIVSPGKRSGLVCSTDRRSGLLELSKTSNLKSKTVIDTMKSQLAKHPRELRRTMTLDNGKEFAQHKRLARVVYEGVYFARPSSPWERGTNENTNGLIRQFFPKRTDFADVSNQQVLKIKQLLNERPRKRLGYKTPIEVFNEQLPKNRRI